mgnify:CR=1 FL=1
METPVFLQSSKGESGAICLAMLLGHYGSFPKLNVVKSACDAGTDEISPDNLVAVAKRFGLNTQESAIDVSNFSKKTPFIIQTTTGSYVVVVKHLGEHYIIHDPEKGKQKIKTTDLEELYNGWTLSVTPGEAFEIIENNTSFFKEIKARILPYTKGIGYVLIAGLILLIPGIIIPSLNKLFFDDIIILSQSHWFEPMITILIVFLVFGCLLVYLQQWILLRTELKLSLVESAKFVLHVLKVPYTYFQNHPTGETVKRIGLNDTIATLLTRDFTTMVISLLTVLFYGFVMVKYNWILTVVGVSVMLINIFALRFFSAKRTALNQALFQKQQATFSVATSGIEQIETLKASGAENDFFSLWSSHLISAINDDQKLGKTSRLLNVLPDFLSQLNNVIILLLGGLLIIYGEISIGVFIAMQSFISNFSDPVKNLVNITGNIQLNKGNMNNLTDTLDETIDPFCDTQPRASIDKITPFNAKLSGKLEVKNLTFGYSKFSPPLIQDFSLSAYPGKQIAIVGGSGSGKSTLLKVISGLYAPRSGEILYDDMSINSINEDVLRNSLSMVDQDSFFFTGTISDNIVMWNRAIENEAIISAAKDAEIHKIISERDGAYQAKVAPDGRNFSGGQRQRLEIARALVTSPSILFLDEATSALDTETERSVMDNFKKRKCTTITIAHRLSTIKDADEIIVLERGKVIERGTHDELMQNEKGFYYKLVNES